MTASIDLDETHKYLRNKLDILGFHYPFPIGAISLVGALVDDLIKTTESLRAAKDEVITLREDKEAWELGVEPYKCDNSRLLAECNTLHQQLLKEREKSDLKLVEITRLLRDLELDKKYLEEHCAELNKKVREFESKSSDPSKRNKDNVNMHKKPFISAVRSGDILSKPCTTSNAEKSCFKMICQCSKQPRAPPTSCTDLQKLENDYQNARDLLETCQKQMDGKEREIQRLTNLLDGGRAPSVLARECCYKGIHELSKDLELLQKEKIRLHSDLHTSITAQHEAMQRATMLEEKNRQLEKETDILERAALEVESKANMALTEKNQKILELQKEMDNLRKQTQSNVRAEIGLDKEKMALKNEIKKVNDEYRALVDKLNETSKTVQDLKNNNDKLAKKNCKLKSKLSNLKETVEIPKEFPERSKPKESYSRPDDVQQILSGAICDEDHNRLRNERDFFQKEYLKMIENRNSHDSVEVLRSELKEKNAKISCLQNEVDMLKSCSKQNAASQSVTATINRLERERDSYKLEGQKLKSERNLLQEKVKLCTERQIADQRNYEHQLQDLYEKLSRCEMEKNQILSTQVPTETAVNLLGSEIEELKRKICETEAENQQLRKRYCQIKILQEQTERSLSDQQSKLMIAETMKGRIESKLSTLDTNREEAEKQVGTLRSDLSVAKSTINAVEREKDKLMLDLDGKTERLFKLENDLRKCENDKRELQNNLDCLKKRFDDKTKERISQEDTLRDVTCETNTLRKQINTLKHSNDNAMVENHRLANELSDSVTELTIVKRKLKDSECEVEKLKLQLQQYVQEVKRVEDLLAKKDGEREEMLDHFRSLSHDAVMLEGNNHSLEMEAAEIKKQLLDAESKIIDLEAMLNIKDNELKSYEKQINDLSRQIAKLEVELENKCEQNCLVKADLAATKDLCDKLDLQKEKLIEELNEHSTIREQLQSENNKLKSEIMMVNEQAGGTGDRKNRMNELLESNRQEIDQYIRNTNALNQEIVKLRRKTDELENQLAGEQSNSVRNEALAHEYGVQLQELRQVLTNERFDSMRSKDDMDNRKFTNRTSDETKETLNDTDGGRSLLSPSPVRKKIEKTPVSLEQFMLSRPAYSEAESASSFYQELPSASTFRTETVHKSSNMEGEQIIIADSSSAVPFYKEPGYKIPMILIQSTSDYDNLSSESTFRKELGEQLPIIDIERPPDDAAKTIEQICRPLLNEAMAKLTPGKNFSPKLLVKHSSTFEKALKRKPSMTVLQQPSLDDNEVNELFIAPYPADLSSITTVNNKDNLELVACPQQRDLNEYDFSALPPPPSLRTLDPTSANDIKLHVFAIAGNNFDQFHFNWVLR